MRQEQNLNVPTNAFDKEIQLIGITINLFSEAKPGNLLSNKEGAWRGQSKIL